jgi:DNA-binding NarL/FixJ family response regulator
VEPIKIIVADDDQFWVEGLRLLTEDDNEIAVVGTTVSLKNLESMVKELKPDVVVLDLAWPGDKAAGIKMIAQLKAEYDDIRIVAITAYPELVELAEAAGAFALKKGFRLDQLIDTIWQAAQNRNELDVASIQKGGEIEVMTEREIEVLREVAKGARDREIAEKLLISEGTVKKHVSSILSKLNANNRAHAAVIAYRKNLL